MTPIRRRENRCRLHFPSRSGRKRRAACGRNGTGRAAFGQASRFSDSSAGRSWCRRSSASQRGCGWIGIIPASARGRWCSSWRAWCSVVSTRGDGSQRNIARSNANIKMIQMNDTLLLLFAFAAGIVLGLAFFGGLWWTVSRVTNGHGAVWLLPLSSLVRTAMLLVGFWFISQGQAARLAACVAGWLLARRFWIRRCSRRENSAPRGGVPCT